nr:hypothetical protein [Candidatus Calescibacterium sp.]
MEKVFGPLETVAFCLGGGLVRFPPRGLVLFMGGDLAYARLLKWWSGYPLWVYDGYPRRLRGVDRYFARFLEDFSTVSFPDKVFLGDLLKSFVDHHPETLELPSGVLRFCFLPGSRPFAYQYLLPFFKACAEELLVRFPRSVFLIAFPAFLERSRVPYLQEVAQVFLTFFGKASQCIEAADVVITIPGSNNFEILYRRKRGIVLVPLWKGSIAEAPILGVWGILGKLPFWGRILKRKVVEKMVSTQEFLVLPNRILKRSVLVELRGNISVCQVVEEVTRLLEAEAPDFPVGDFPGGAAERLAAYVLEELYAER